MKSLVAFNECLVHRNHPRPNNEKDIRYNKRECHNETMEKEMNHQFFRGVYLFPQDSEHTPTSKNSWCQKRKCTKEPLTIGIIKTVNGTPTTKTKKADND